MCTRTSNRQKLSNTAYIKGEASRLLRTKSSKQHLKKTLLYSKRDYATEVTSITFSIDKTLSEVNSRERMPALQNKQKNAQKKLRLSRNIALLCLT